MKEINDPVSFFDRADSLYHNLDFRFNQGQTRYWKSHRLRWLADQTKMLARSVVLYRRLMKTVDDPMLRAEYRRRVKSIWRKRREPASLFIYVLKCAVHFHYFKIAQGMERDNRKIVNTF